MKPFYEMTQAEVGRHLRSVYDAQPKADWDKLAVGDVLLHKGRGWRIVSIPPKRGYVMATHVMTGETEKLLRSQYACADLMVTDEATLALFRTSHEEEIRKALAAGITISLAVQYDYPDIFTPYPSSWDEKQREKANDLWRRINEMRAYQDHNEAPGWQLRKVAYMRRQAKKDIARSEEYRAEVEAGVGIKKREAIPGIVANVNESISESKESIKILNHLRKHLEKTLGATQ
jgi:hypothetical protein